MSWPIQFAALIAYLTLGALAVILLNVALVAARDWLRDHLNP